MLASRAVIRDRLERFRKKLLDTSRRNKLVNFRSHSKTGNKPIEKVVVVEGEDCSKVLGTLVQSATPRAMSFVGRPDKGSANNELELLDDETGGEPELDVDQDDDKLNTLLTKSRLDRHLTKIRRDQIEMIEEQGINALYLALGQLKWMEAEHSREVRLAPLVLVPVLLDRTDRGGFKLRWDGTEVGSNLSLAALLKEEFAIELPLIDNDEFDLNAYLDRVKQAVSIKLDWTIKRDAISLGFFSFAKQLIYKDLSPDSWPADRDILSHETLENLLFSGFAESETTLSEEDFLDELRPIGETNEVFDADGSQTLAILQALGGDSMVIEGPPGTGKSQTIANLIAEFVGQGKKVLFVSEKSAALNVVFDRMKSANLDMACLELHGTKAKKAAFYQNLRETIAQKEPRLVDAENTLRQLSAQRVNLNKYVQDLHAMDHRGATPRTALGKLVQLGLEVDTDGRIDPHCFDEWNLQKFQEARELVSDLQDQVQSIGFPTDHPFYGTLRTYISPDDKADLTRAIESSYVGFDEFREAVLTQTKCLCLCDPSGFEDVLTLESSIAFVLLSPDTIGVDFDHLAWQDRVEDLRLGANLAQEVEIIRANFKGELLDDSWSEPVGKLLKSLLPPGIESIDICDVNTWKKIDQAAKNAVEVKLLAESICQDLKIAPAEQFWAMEIVVELGSLLSNAPNYSELRVESSAWLIDHDLLMTSINETEKAASIKQEAGTSVKPSSWDDDVSGVSTVIERDGSSVLKRIFGKEFKAARMKALLALQNQSSKPSEILGSLRLIEKYQRSIVAAKPGISAVREHYGNEWKGEGTNFDSARAALNYLTKIHSEIKKGRLSPESITILRNPSILKHVGEQASKLQSLFSECSKSMLALNEVLESHRGPQQPSLTGDPRERIYRYLLESIVPAKAKASSLRTNPSEHLSLPVIVNQLSSISSVQAKSDAMGQLENILVGALSHRWTNREGHLNEIQVLIEWVSDFVQQVNHRFLPNGLLKYFRERPKSSGLSQALSSLKKLREHYCNQLARVATLAELDGGAEQFLRLPFATQEATINAWRQRVDRIEDYFRFNSLCGQCAEQGLNQIVALSLNWQHASTRLLDEYDRAWWNLVADNAIQDRPSLRNFDRPSHEEMRAKFVLHDQELIQLNRKKVAFAHWSSVPRGNAVGEMGFLNLQMNRQRGHRPIRVAMKEAASAVQAIKPVFLMSPMSVAMYLPPEGPLFDVVLFDEASQIKPEDALGSVIRAKQMIVVGDTKQMPPTSVFDKLTSNTEDDEDESEDDTDAATKIITQDIIDQESILSFASARIPDGSSRRRDLRWHYRSRHEDLIRTSNRLFYRDRLIIFPHPTRLNSEMGLIFRHLPNTTYARGDGKSHKNVLEARAVAEAARDHVINSPHLSCGLVAFSKAQQEAIEDELDILRKSEPAFAEFDKQHGLNRLFVKNLESVQGDERDVIFISIGYGRDESGFLGMSFGPLNKEGGERRLNVLITRARIRTIVFSNFTASDMRIGESKSRGIECLHTFLAFAESGHLDVASSVLMMEPSYFEEVVFEQLRNRGYEVEKQIGSEGFFIDLAIRHPSLPGRYAIGIECDGAMYHSAKSARDRDRLRQQVLEDRGWTIYRIWSTDWWRHPQQELDRCCAAIERSFGSRPAPELPLSRQMDPTEREETEPSVEIVCDEVNSRSSASAEPYVFAELNWTSFEEIPDLSTRTILNYVKEVIDIESPVHLDEIVRRIREAASKGRAGRLIREKIERSVSLGEHLGELICRGDFVYRNNQSEFKARTREHFPAQCKKIELIAPEEILDAIKSIIRDSIAVPWEEVAKPVGRFLGFDRVTEQMEAHVNDLLTNFCQSDSLIQSHGKLRLPPS